jgi:hypothetical protein
VCLCVRAGGREWEGGREGGEEGGRERDHRYHLSDIKLSRIVTPFGLGFLSF